ncbi:hypothetical protein BGZ76_010172 [Entomortierella beljakovae]|nr:hypothetical protein BGZ76_010172 [Entomortierella beljakovae]
MVKAFSFALLSIATAISAVAALDTAGQFKRLAACPTLGCLSPPDNAEFLAGSHFDVRVEVHAEDNAQPNPNYSLTIEKLGGSGKDNKHGNKPKAIDFTKWSKVKPSSQEKWNFTYFKDASAYWKAQDGDKNASTPVNVASTAWRSVQIKEPGTYKAVLTYNNGKKTEAIWTVNPVHKRKAKNVILFIGDGMSTAMITAARLISQPHVSGKYKKHLHMDQFPATIIDQMIHGANPVVADVILGGGGKYFHSKTGGKSLNGTDYYAAFSKERGYKVVNDRKGLLSYKGSDPLLGIFHSGNMDVWMDRNVYKGNLNKTASDPTGNGGSALNQPNLDEMVIKGLDVLQKRHGKEGWFMMAEAASVDKMMHPLDYDRALADLLELDRSIGKTKEWLKRNKLDKDTLILVTADHAHSFDVYGSVDTQYFNSFSDSEELEKKNSIGTYENSGWPSYVDADGDGFPDDWNVRYTLAAGTAGFPSHREDFQVNINGVRVPAIAKSNSHHHYSEIVANPDEDPHGIIKTGTLGAGDSVGVHSLQDVPIFATGPGSNLFSGVQDNTEIFHKISEVLGLGEQN